MRHSRGVRLDTLFERALEVPRVRREAFLAEACPDDGALREEVLSLLNAHDAAGDYFEGLSNRVLAPALSALSRASDPSDRRDTLDDLQVRLGGAYRLERELGGGGMSRVFVAEDLGLKRPVVIKVLGPEMVPTVKAERFRREIELAAHLQHPHIVPLLSADTADGTSYYTMPFVRGESLRERLAREGALPVEDAVSIWRDVLDALAHAHGRGVIHRDIKPGNILLSERNALVTDFGIARALETAAVDPRTTTPGLAIGTPAYMAPEQAAGEGDADQRVDIYQAGLVMYEMLAGRLPFDVGSTRDLLTARVTREPQWLERTEAPGSLIDLVMRCLARQPGERPQSADAVLAELELVAKGETPAPTTEGSGGARRAPSVALYAVAALALTAMVFATIRQPGPSLAPEGGAPTPAIAVLPLANLSDDPADAALADGMTQELAAVLGASTTLHVVASPLQSELEALGMDLGRIADSLHVDHFLQGSIQKDGVMLRMQIRLIDPRDGSTSWSETYDRNFAAVFDVQNEIARGVARELQARLRPRADRGVEPRPHTPDVVAYEWYLRGMDVALLRSSSGQRQGIEYFQRAVTIDPSFAGAYAGLVRMYVSIFNAAPANERQGWLALAQEAADQAVALDDSDPEALAALGWARFMSRDYRAGEAAFTRALALNSDVPRGHEGLAALYMMVGRPAEQLAEARLSLESDPFSHSAIRELALALATNGRCWEALDQLRALKALTPPAGVAGVISGQCYASQEMWPEAIAEFRWAGENSSAAFALAFLGYSLARAGQGEEAAGILSDLQSGRRDSHGAFGVATVYAGMRDYDQAFAWLDKAIDENSVNHYLMHPIFADLHRDPRFERVKERLGIPSP